MTVSTVESKKPPVRSPRKPPRGSSFADKYPELVSEWSSDNDYSPKEIFARSGIKIKWICSTDGNHTWKASPEKRRER